MTMREFCKYQKIGYIEKGNKLYILNERLFRARYANFEVINRPKISAYNVTEKICIIGNKKYYEQN